MIHIHSDIIKSKKIFVKVYSFPTLCSKLLGQANKRKEKQSDFSTFSLQSNKKTEQQQQQRISGGEEGNLAQVIIVHRYR